MLDRQLIPITYVLPKGSTWIALMRCLSGDYLPSGLWPEDGVGRESAAEEVVVGDVACSHRFEVWRFELAVYDASSLGLHVSGKVDHGKL